MCLINPKKLKRTEDIGYKIVEVDKDGRYYSLFELFIEVNPKEYKINSIYVDKFGFHYFPILKDAQYFYEFLVERNNKVALLKIKAEGEIYSGRTKITTMGTDESFESLARRANKITILEEIKTND